jgi:hypothetical protein
MTHIAVQGQLNGKVVDRMGKVSEQQYHGNRSVTYVTYVTHYDPGNAEDNEGDRARLFRRS